MLRANVLLANFIVLAACFFACPAGNSQDPATAPQYAQIASSELSRESLVLELDRAILVLKQGQKERWETRDAYLVAFGMTSGTDATGRPVTIEKNYVECAMRKLLPLHEVWDERLPIDVEVQRTIDELTKRREDQDIVLRPSPCMYPMPRRVLIAGGVAEKMLTTKLEPVYPEEAFENHVSGTVVLNAVISTKGMVQSLHVVSGPPMLQQAALDAIKYWIYRPYMLNNIPVEFETTISVVFVPKH